LATRLAVAAIRAQVIAHRLGALAEDLIRVLRAQLHDPEDVVDNPWHRFLQLSGS
jgi:hypothetical protein